MEIFLGALVAELCNFENQFGPNRTEAPRAENARSARITLWAGPNCVAGGRPPTWSPPGDSQGRWALQKTIYFSQTHTKIVKVN